MSTTIDEKVVEMRFDNKDFAEKTKDTVSLLDKLKNALKLDGATKGFENIDKAAKNTNISSVGKAVEDVKLKFSALEVVAVTALSNITNKIVNMAQSLINDFTMEPVISGMQEYETQINAVQTILANTSSKGTTLQQVNAALDELNHYADLTIYNFTEMTRNIGTFTAAGIDLDTSVSAIQGIANLAAVSGSTSLQASTAMYQLSQALAAGTVKLQDWNSVVNAGMGGQVFQDALKETARVHGIAVDQMIEEEGSFRESLQKGWITADILTETLSKFTKSGVNEYIAKNSDLTAEAIRKMREEAQAADGAATDYDKLAESIAKKSKLSKDEIKQLIQMSDTAEDAATKVKTFSQLMDTLKEAAQSGWTQSWEIIIGDFEEAKEFYTEISNAISNIINSSADARNAMLSAGLSSGWKQLLNEGIDDEEGFIEAIENVAKKHNIAIDQMIEDAGSFEKSLKKGWVTSDILTEALDELTDKTKKLSDEQLSEMGYTREQVDKLEELNKKFKDGTLSADEFAKGLSKISGREHLIQSLRNAFNGLLAVLEPFQKAKEEFFPSFTGDQIYDFTIKVENLSKKLILNEENLSKLERTFRGFFAVLHIGYKALETVATGFKDLLVYLSPAASNILDITSNIGDFLVELDNSIAKADIFKNALSKTEEALLPYGEMLKTIASSLYDVTKVDTSHIFDFTEKVEKRFEPLNRIIEEFEKNFKKVFDIFDTLKPTFSNAEKTIGNTLGLISESLKEAFSLSNFDSLFDLINGSIFSVILLYIKNFFKSFSSITKDGFDFLGGITETLDTVRDSLKTWQNSLRAKTLVTLATAIAILAGSLTVLALIDSKKLTGALGAITVLFVELSALMAFTNSKIDFSNFKGIHKVMSLIITLALAVDILAIAVDKMGSLSFNQLIKGLIGVTVLLGGISASAKYLSSDSGKITKGATRIILLSVAINILAIAVEKLGKIRFKDLIKGLSSVGIMLLELAAFSRLADFKNFGVFKAAAVIELAAALNILAAAAKSFASISPEGLDKSITAIGWVLVIVGMFFKLNSESKHMITSSTGIVILSSAMIILSKALSVIGKLSVKEIAKGIGALASALLSISVAMIMLPDGMISKSLGIVAVASALLLISKVVQDMSTLSWEEIAKGFSAIGGAMVILAVGLNAMKGCAGSAVSIMIVTLALNLFVPILQTLGKMSWKEIATGLITLAGAFTIIGVAGLLLSPLIPSIIGLSVAIALLSVGCVACGAGVLMLATGLTTLAVSGAGLGVTIAGIITGIASTIPIVLKNLGEGIVALAEVIGTSGPALIKAFETLLVSIAESIKNAAPAIVTAALELLKETLNSLITYIPDIARQVFDLVLLVFDALIEKTPQLVQKVSEFVKVLVNSIFEEIVGADTSSIESFVKSIGMLSGIVIALGALSSFLPSAMVAVVQLGIVIAELAGVLAALGGISKIPGLSWLIESGGNFLQTIGTAIGQFVGGIVGGIAAGATEKLKDIGSNLSDFMTSLNPFLEGASKISEGTLSGISSLAKAILTLTASDIISGIASFISGKASLSSFAEELEPLGDALSAYSNSVTDVKPDAIARSADAAKSLVELSNNLPRSGGIFQDWFGNKTMDTFGEQLVTFGDSLSAYSKSISGVTEGSVDKSNAAAKAISALIDALPETGGIFSSWFGGKINFTTFGIDLTNFGQSMSDFTEATSGVNEGAVTAASNMATIMTTLQDAVPDTESGLFSHSTTLADVGRSLVSFGREFSSFYDSISGISASQIATVTTEMKRLVEMAKTMEGINTGAVSGFSSALTSVANSGINGFLNAFTGAYAKAQNVGSTFIQRFVAGVKSKQSMAIQSFNQLLTAIMNALKAKANSFTSIGQSYSVKMANGIRSGAYRMSSAIGAAASRAASTARDYYNNFYNAGYHLAVGFANGIDSGAYKAKVAARAMANEATRAAKKALDEHSPSKVMYKIGDYAVQGFVNALYNGVSEAYNSSKAIADAASNGIESALTMIGSVVSGDLDVQPVIAPVVDMSDATAGVQAVNRLFGSTSGKRLGQITADINARLGNLQVKDITRSTSNADVVDAITNLEDAMYNMQLVMDTGALVGSVGNRLDRQLGMKTLYKGRGN